ncbi:hypothetical protein [Comamonas sp.]|uniref:hypothetical protein n=1 Tax=Comamonas sp. TaxID=34028 RepID=UPI0028AB58C1|nr:hypothetical protein [Comamonas sp.]
MQIRHPVLLVILVIIGVGIVNSLFVERPKVDEKEAAAQEDARIKANVDLCASKGLIYSAGTGAMKGECITLAEAKKMSIENEKKLQELQREKLNQQLK